VISDEARIEADPGVEHTMRLPACRGTLTPGVLRVLQLSRIAGEVCSPQASAACFSQGPTTLRMDWGEFHRTIYLIYPLLTTHPKFRGRKSNTSCHSTIRIQKSGDKKLLSQE
jgi:hypothetical protein